ncbi:MAG: bifunctional 4-hydroxy-2-oxoglutarate aldolase/2-dehydro-3-deoxy-phosphogluconate aldolase [Propionicimonas sp.]
MNVMDVLSTHRIVPVVVLHRVVDAGPLGEALVAGGLPVAEVTFRTSAAVDSLAELATRGDILVGAGTVLTPAQVDLAVDAGARFIVSPGLSRSVVERARERGIDVLPGAVTATEIQTALELGIKTVKFFPAETSGGAAAIKALAAPFTGVTFVPTGGVGPANLKDYLSLSSVAAVGGSWMVPAAAIDAGDFETVQRLTARAVAALKDLP